MYGWNNHITIGHGVIYNIKIPQGHIHDIYQRQGNHIITVIQIDSGGTEEMKEQPINTEHQQGWVLYQL